MEESRITLRLPAGLAERLRREAARRGITLHDFIVSVLWEELRRTAPE